MTGETMRMVLSALAGAGVCGSVFVWHGGEGRVRPRADLDGGVIGQVDGEAIREADLVFEMELRHAVGAEGREMVVEEMVERKLMAAAARRAGIGQRADVRRRYELMLGQAMREVLESEDGEADRIDEEMLQERYNAAIESFRTPGRSRVAMVYVDTREGRGVVERAWEAAATADEKAFAQVVLEFSDDQATKFRSGDLGYLVEGMVGGAFSAEIADAVFALGEPGELTEVFECKDGWRFFRLADRQAGAVKSFREVRGELLRRLQGELDSKLEAALIERCIAGIPKVLDWERIGEVALPVRSGDATGLEVSLQGLPGR